MIVISSTAASWPHKYFRRDEVECKCGCKGVPKTEFLVKLDKLRETYGKPIKITSGYRCLSHNTLVGGSLTSKHIEGIAVDIACTSAEGFTLAQIALKMGFGGIGVAKTFLHLDTRPQTEGRLWTY